MDQAVDQAVERDGEDTEEIRGVEADREDTDDGQESLPDIMLAEPETSVEEWLRGEWIAVVWEVREDRKMWYVGRLVDDIKDGELEFMVDHLTRYYRTPWDLCIDV